MFVIAEAGVNHNGRTETALAMIDAAADAGADAFKVQVFRADDLVTRAARTAAYQRKSGETQHAMLRALELDDAALAAIRGYCAKRRIALLATPFGVGDVERLVRLGVPAIKLASTDLTNPLLLGAAAATGLPLILSTGASRGREIEATVRRLRRGGSAARLALLHCVSSYPTPPECANLRAIRALSERFGVPAGFSDHTLSITAGALAAAAGACVLEKHFTLDRSASGPDHAMSLTPVELRRYIEGVREAETLLGDGSLGYQDVEAEVRRVARRSVVAAIDLAAGVVLDANAVTLKRPAGGIAPEELEVALGRRTTAAIARDTPITWDMLE